MTLIVGGAFHGKSTLLDALASGIRAHPPRDGREGIAVLPEAVLVRAEPGRSVRSVDISPFLGGVPSGARSSEFSSESACGTTSQAAGIVEAMELGARVLLLDEDTSATNLLIRDERMQRLVPRPAEPVVAVIHRVRELYESFGISTILATGSSGDALGVADTVILMNSYRPEDATKKAREIASLSRSVRPEEKIPRISLSSPRVLTLEATVPSGGLRAGLHGGRGVRIGNETIDLKLLDQIGETGEVRAIAELLREAAGRMERGAEIGALVSDLLRMLDEGGLDVLDPPAAYDLSRPRAFEIAAALNRWRSVRARRAERNRPETT